MIADLGASTPAVAWYCWTCRKAVTYQVSLVRRSVIRHASAHLAVDEHCLMQYMPSGDWALACPRHRTVLPPQPTAIAGHGCTECVALAADAERRGARL